MRVLAYCAAQFQESTRRAAGVKPLTCPPFSGVDLAMLLLDSNRPVDLLYLAVHGKPGSWMLYGDEEQPALSISSVKMLKVAKQPPLSHVVVFASTCYFPQTPFLRAFLAGGAVVIAGDGQNFTPPHELAGASLLGLWVRRGLEWGLSPEWALQLAKVRVRSHLVQQWAISRIQASPAVQSQIAGDEDALQFQVYRG